MKISEAANYLSKKRNFRALNTFFQTAAIAGTGLAFLSTKLAKPDDLATTTFGVSAALATIIAVALANIKDNKPEYEQANEPTAAQYLKEDIAFESRQLGYKSGIIGIGWGFGIVMAGFMVFGKEPNYSSTIAPMTVVAMFGFWGAAASYAKAEKNVKNNLKLIEDAQKEGTPTAQIAAQLVL